MRIGKRVLPLCLVASVLFTVLQTVFAEGKEEYTDYSDKIEFLNAVGITDIKTNSFSAEENVTREMFAEGISAMLIEDLGSTGLTAVGDLSSEDRGMLYLNSVGVINGIEKDVFDPNGIVTLEQASKIAVTVLGFKGMADYNGGYSNGYVAQAQKLGLLDGIKISSSEELCMGDYVTMLYNLTDIDIMQPDKLEGGKMTYKQTEGNTLLSVYRHIKKAMGTVNSNRYSGLYSEYEVTSGGEVKINNEYFAVGSTNAEEYLGVYTEFFYHDSDDEKTILYISPSKKNKSLLIRSSDIISCNAGVYTYEDEKGRKRSIRIPNQAVIIYNNAFRSNLDAGKFIPSYGSVEFISNDGGSSYDVIKIQDITLTVVMSTSSDKCVIYDKYDSAYNLDLTDREYSVTLANGSKGTIANINKGNVIETVKTDSTAQSFYKMTVVTDSVTGDIQMLDDEAYYLNGTRYELSVHFKKLISDGKIIKPEVGRAYTFLLSSIGEIVAVGDESDKAFRIGYFKRFMASEDGFGEEKQVRIFDQSGAWELYDLAEKVKINGNWNESRNIENMDMYIGMVCKYELNVAGEVMSMYFPSEGDSNFRKVYSLRTAYYRKYKSGPVFGPEKEDDGNVCAIYSNAVMFVIPDAEANTVQERSDNYQYAVIAPSRLPGYEDYRQVDIYNTEGEFGIGDVAVVRMSNYGYTQNEYSFRPVMINEIYSVYDDGGIKKEIKGLSNGREIKFFVEDYRTDQSVFPFERGDLIFCFYGSDRVLRLYDNVKYYHMLLDYDDENPVFAKSFDWNAGSPIGVSYRSSMTATERIRYGSVYKSNGEYMWFNTSDDPGDDTSLEAFKYSDAVIYVYGNDKKYRVGSVSDVVGYTEDAENYSKALVVFNDSFTEIFVY